jgi:uncharacterized protein (TIGR03067 family)
MRPKIVLIVAAGLLAAGAARADDPAKAELAQLEGTWAVTAREFMGKKASEEDIKKLKAKIVVKGDMVTVKSLDVDEEVVVAEGKLKLDPTTKPKSLDVTFTGGANKGETGLAIYELTGDALKVCIAVGEDKRPTEFAGPKNQEWIYIEYKREKK